MAIAGIAQLPVVLLQLDYKPTRAAWNFHLAEERFRYAVWGFKSGKSVLGAVEFVRHALGKPGGKHWVVAPTNLHLEEAEQQVDSILYKFPGLVSRRTQRPSNRWLSNGGLIQFKSAEYPDHLRGPNVDTIWVEEGAYLKPKAWQIARSRGAARKADIFITTTPNGRNWLWPEVLEGGMNADQKYGEFRNGRRYVSHFATWHFEWVEEDEIADAKKMMPAQSFDQDYGALFVTDSSMVFRHVEESMTWEPPPPEVKGPNVIGVDLARHQDWTVAVVMEGSGRVLDIERWNQVSWTIQRARIISIAKQWDASVILDVSNVGDVIEEDLTAAGVHIVKSNLSDWRIKNDIIQRLQVAFEQNLIRLPDYRAPWAPPATEILYEELKTYEYHLTRGGHVSYGAPKGLHDDTVMALALANFGKVHGYAGGAGSAAEVVISREEWAKISARGLQKPSLAKARSRVFGSVFNRKRKSSMGWEPNGRFWG